jgi:hypothetical protein
MIGYFSYKHLPEHLQVISKPFHDLAVVLIDTLPDNREKEKALDKLLEAKDAAVRSNLNLKS